MSTGRSTPQPLVALFGPTSSGKTRVSVDLALRVADQLGVEPVVISADSRQVYRGLDIGTSKTTAEQMRGIRHEMISVADPVRKYELESYVAQARGHIEACWAAGKLPLIVGGTAIYVKALLEGWDVDRTAGSSAALRRDFPRAMAADAHQTLRRLDPGAAERVHPNNYDGVINALAALMSRDDAAPGSRKGPEPTPPSAVRTVVLGLDRPARELDDRVARTFDEQLRRGLLQEVVELSDRYDLEGQLRRRGKDSPNQVIHTHGYREFLEVARDSGKPVHSLAGADLDAVREAVVDHIRAYTRRQRGAFRKLPGLRMTKSAGDAYRAVVKAGLGGRR